MTSKLCKTKNGKGCGLKKELNMFRFRKDTNKYSNICKKCKSLQNKNRNNGYSKERKEHIKKQKRNYSHTLSGRYMASKKGATEHNRNYCYELSKKDYGKLTNNQLCIYCGGTDGTEDNKYVGVDRVCNEIGYKIGNVVPCCKTCNSMKMEMSYVQFINVCNMIAKKHNNKF